MTMNIGARILIGFLLLLALMGGLGAYQIGSMTAMRQASVDILESDFEALERIRRIRFSQEEMRTQRERAVGVYFLGEAGLSEKSSRAAQQQWEFARRRTLDAVNELLALSVARQERARIAENMETWRTITKNAEASRGKIEELASAVNAEFELLNKNETGNLKGDIEIVDALRVDFDKLMDELDELAGSLVAVSRREIDNVYLNVRKVFMIAFGAASIFAALIAWIIHRSIAQPLFELVSYVEKVGRGDLTQKIRNLGKDEMGRLARQFNEMTANLADTTRQTLTAASNVSGATAQLQAAVAQQAASTSEQRAAIQEITTTLSEISQSGSQISERAQEVARAVEETSGASRSGAEAVGATYEVMGAIREQAEAVAENIVSLTEKTRSVGDIVANVNDIAERSSLLALNAAIEASAAGEQGQSFAVVADEMKSLAAQAKDATAQVQALLRDIQQGISTSAMQTEEAVKRTESGRLQSERMKDSIERLVDNIETSLETFEQIVAATNQQQIGIEQVTQAIQDIRVSSGQVADGTRDLEGAAANLNALGAQLQKSVQRYQLA
ncbi:MAG: methyl-accepting chemotaxis protein [Amphiplicatus sp.]